MFADYLYLYRIDVTGVYDGDSITADIHTGFGHVMQGQKFRLYGINAPELRGKQKAEGKITRDWLRERILGQTVTIRSHKDKSGKYGRWLCEVFAKDEYGQVKNLNHEMVRLGLAEENFYR